MAALLVAGLAAGCGLRMARMDAQLMDSGVQTVSRVQVSWQFESPRQQAQLGSILGVT